MLSALYISRCLVPAPSYSTYQRHQLGFNLHVFPVDDKRFQAKGWTKDQGLLSALADTSVGMTTC